MKCERLIGDDSRMESKRGQFNSKDFASLADNNLVAASSLVLEQAFERSMASALDMNGDWQSNAWRAAITFIIYNGIKVLTLILRDENGWTKSRKAFAWVWVKLFGE